MSQRAKFHHRQYGRPLKERCRQIGCGGELRELRPGFGYATHPDGSRAGRRHGMPVKVGLLGRCSKCGTHVNIRSVMGIEIDGSAATPETVNETVTLDEDAA